jgi:hypothetical protein
MPPVGLELTISAGEWPQAYALDRAATLTAPLPPLLCENRTELRKISEFRRCVVKTFVFPSCYAAYLRSCLPAFQDSYTLEDWADRRR